MYQAIQKPRTRVDTNGIAIAASIVTCAVVLLLAASGWSF
jgi:hypothetical protein